MILVLVNAEIKKESYTDTGDREVSSVFCAVCSEHGGSALLTLREEDELSHWKRDLFFGFGFLAIDDHS